MQYACIFLFNETLLVKTRGHRRSVTQNWGGGAQTIGGAKNCLKNLKIFLKIKNFLFNIKKINWNIKLEI